VVCARLDRSFGGLSRDGCVVDGVLRRLRPARELFMLLGCREIIEASYIRKGSLAKRMEGHHIMARNGWRAVVNISAFMVSATRFWPRPIAVATFSGAEPPWHRILGTTNLPYSCNRTRTLVERSKTSKKKKGRSGVALYIATR
jgi:hypothetical protein